jgi:hypothetical protein
MTTTTANWNEAISDIIQFQSDIDDDFNRTLVDFHGLDELLKSHMFGFVRVGMCAERIRNFKLWERANVYKDWNHYCQAGLGKTSWYINRLIDASKIVILLIESGFKVLPHCEAQCRPLVKLANGVGAIDNVAHAWHKVTSMFTPDKITADRVAAVAEDRDPDQEKITKGISKQTIELAYKLAKAEGKTVDDLLRELLRDRAETEPIEPDSIEAVTIVDPIKEEILDALDRQFAQTQTKVITCVDRVHREVDRVVRSVRVRSLRFDWFKTDRGWMRA